jgi:flagellar hook-basal body complex protein FliE
MTIGRIIQPVFSPAGSIGSIGSLGGLSETTKSTGNSTPMGDFGSMVSNGMNSVNNDVKSFETISEKFAKGDKVSLQELMLTGERADVSLKLMTTLRNKVLEAYQEIMRMPV